MHDGRCTDLQVLVKEAAAGAWLLRQLQLQQSRPQPPQPPLHLPLFAVATSDAAAAVVAAEPEAGATYDRTLAAATNRVSTITAAAHARAMFHGSRMIASTTDSGYCCKVDGTCQHDQRQARPAAIWQWVAVEAVRTVFRSFRC